MSNLAHPKPGVSVNSLFCILNYNYLPLSICTWFLQFSSLKYPVWWTWFWVLRSVYFLLSIYECTDIWNFFEYVGFSWKLRELPPLERALLCFIFGWIAELLSSGVGQLLDVFYETAWNASSVIILIMYTKYQMPLPLYILSEEAIKMGRFKVWRYESVKPK